MAFTDDVVQRGLFSKRLLKLPLKLHIKRGILGGLAERADKPFIKELAELPIHILLIDSLRSQFLHEYNLLFTELGILEEHA